MSKRAKKATTETVLGPQDGQVGIVTKERAPTRTAKRQVVEVEGYDAKYWDLLNDADRAVVSAYIRAGSVAEATAAYEQAKVRAHAITATAEKARDEATKAEEGYRLVLEKLDDIRTRAEGKPEPQ